MEGRVDGDQAVTFQSCHLSIGRSAGGGDVNSGHSVDENVAATAK